MGGYILVSRITILKGKEARRRRSLVSLAVREKEGQGEGGMARSLYMYTYLDHADVIGAVADRECDGL